MLFSSRWGASSVLTQEAAEIADLALVDAETLAGADETGFGLVHQGGPVLPEIGQPGLAASKCPGISRVPQPIDCLLYSGDRRPKLFDRHLGGEVRLRPPP